MDGAQDNTHIEAFKAILADTAALTHTGGTLDGWTQNIAPSDT